MIERERSFVLRTDLLLALILLTLVGGAGARQHTSIPRSESSPTPVPAKKSLRQDDSIALYPTKDLFLRREGEHKAEALAHFIEGMAFEENGEMDKALAAYRKVLDVDPGQAELASRVGALLAREEEFPQAIDVLKDTIKANPTATDPLLQLSFIYFKYLRRTEQALDYVNQAITINPRNVDAYQRLCEIAIAAGDENNALQALDRAAKLQSDDARFWVRLGKLYASIVVKPDVAP